MSSLSCRHFPASTFHLSFSAGHGLPLRALCNGVRTSISIYMYPRLQAWKIVSGNGKGKEKGKGNRNKNFAISVSLDFPNFECILAGHLYICIPL